MDICSEVEWYKVIQLAFPEATTFVDIGANKGYLGSLFLGLWGGAGLGVSPKKVDRLNYYHPHHRHRHPSSPSTHLLVLTCSLASRLAEQTFELSKRLDVWPKSRNPSGYCKDGVYYI